MDTESVSGFYRLAAGLGEVKIINRQEITQILTLWMTAWTYLFWVQIKHKDKNPL